jgi:hypothetical protein
VDILRVNVSEATLQDLAELEHYENLKEAHLRWSRGPSGKEALPILKRCTNLRRLILGKWELDTTFSSKELCDFITELKHLTFLHIIYHDNPDCNHFKSVVDEVKTFVLSRRPNFKFYISCCEMFDESRVESCT